ncbi:MAG TPA: ATP-binding protein, partial [Flavisolibacter sp.]|nr:ATP-binding protein [Flavisolibacter sp.]
MTKHSEKYEQLLTGFIETQSVSDELITFITESFQEPDALDKLVLLHTEVTEKLARALHTDEHLAFFASANQFLGHIVKIHAAALSQQNKASGIEQYAAKEQVLEQARIATEHISLNSKRMLAVMSHEIRSPMNALMGITRILSETDLTPEQAEYIGIIQRSGESLLSIINNLLDLSKIEADKMEIERVVFDPIATISEVYDLLAVTADEKGLDLVHLFESEVPSLIESDQQRFRQILMNLVTNGIKFTDEGEVFIQARVVDQQEEDYELEFMVRDSGIGISVENIGEVFDEYSQVDYTHRHGGTGLGLAICKKLVGLLQGKIWVESIYGEGAAFFFTIKTTAKNNW